jgi:hypothetical protein
VRPRRRLLPALALAVTCCVSACDAGRFPADPVSRPSEVAGEVWFCTPGQIHGRPGDDKASTSAVRIEIVTPAANGSGSGDRFPPNTVLGRATAAVGERWPAGSVHPLLIAWLQPGITRSDLQSESLRVRITRNLGRAGPFPSVDAWGFSFFISLDVVTYGDAGDRNIDWHLAVASTDEIVTTQDQPILMDTPFSELRGWPHPCPKA